MLDIIWSFHCQLLVAAAYSKCLRMGVKPGLPCVLDLKLRNNNLLAGRQHSAREGAASEMYMSDCQ